MAVSKNTPTIIVSAGAVLREGIASLLQNTHYNIVGYAVGPADLPHITSPKGERMLAIVGWDRQSQNVEDTIRPLRSSMPHGKVVLLAGTNQPTELERTLALSADACIFNLGSRHTLLKVLELTFRNQQVFVFGESAARTARDSTALLGSRDDKSNPSNSSPLVGHWSQTICPLSPRECEILMSLAEGKSNKMIARLYNLSESTVKVHQSHLA
jgi:two-component system nitrate/nitrite response regulator NarL